MSGSASSTPVEEESHVAVALDVVMRNLSDLGKYANYQRDKLPEAAQSKLRDVMSAFAKAVHSENYVQLMNHAAQVFGNVTQAQRGTVAYIFRAWTLEPVVGKGMDDVCSLERSGVLPSPQKTVSQRFCASHVGTITKDGFTMHHTPPTASDSVYIYLHLKSDDEFTQDHISKSTNDAIKKYGLKKYAYVFVNEDGTASVTKQYDAANLGGYPGNGTGSGSGSCTKKGNNDDESWGVVIAVVIFVIFLIIIFIAFWMSYRGSARHHAQQNAAMQGMHGMGMGGATMM